MNTNDRRYELIKILCKRRYDTVSNLANEFNVSYRTIRRDIEVLSLHIPIYTQRGKFGGVFLLDNYFPNNTYMTDTEIAILQKIVKINSFENILSKDEVKICISIINKYSKPYK